MNNEAIQRLREPVAWVLLGAVTVQMLAGLLGIFAVSEAEGLATNFGPSPIPSNMTDQAGNFFSPVIAGLVVLAVWIAVTARQKSPRASVLVIFGLVLLGIGALYGFVTLITGFFAFNEGLDTASYFFNTLAWLAVMGAAVWFLLKVFGDPELVPRSAPAGPQMGFQPGPYPGFPATGAQQSFAPQPDPGMTGQGYVTGGQYPYAPQPAPQQDWSGQPVYPDPGQTGSGWPQSQPQYADPSLSGGQQPYYSQPYEQPMGYDQQQPAPGQPYGYQEQPGAVPSGGQQPYPEGAGAAWGQQQEGGYDPYGQQPAPNPYEQPYGYSPTGGQPAGYTSYGDAYQQPAYQEGAPADQGYASGGQQPYAGGYDADAEQTMVSQPGQPQPYGDWGTGGYAAAPGDQGGATSERAAQDAIQYGWYQQQPPISEAPPAEQRPDTPMEQFYRPNEPAQEYDDAEQTMRVDPNQGGTYSQQQDDRQQGWYRDDDRR